MATIYYTGCTLDGFIATDDHSLDWLTSRDIDMEGPMAYPGFREQLGACVMGATTWQWILDHDDEPWGPLPTWVLTHRTFPEAPPSVRFDRDDVRRVHAEMTEAADGKDLLKRVMSLPGFGKQKAQIFVALLAKQVGVRPEGWESAVGDYALDGHRSVADVVDPDSLQKVRDFKKAKKAAAKTSG